MRKLFYVLSVLLAPFGMLAQKNNLVIKLPTAHSMIRAWQLRGNSGTNPALNFLGTLDATPLVFRVNNQLSGYLDYDSTKGNAGFGYQALQLNASVYNSAMGYRALSNNTIGQYNAALGSNAMASNTSGLGNTGIGAYSLFGNTTGSFNTAIGEDAMFATTAGSNNVGIGNQALVKNTFGSNNVAIGSTAMYWNNASDNSAYGASSLYDNTTGSSNAAFGEYSLFINTAGNSNTALGNGALFGNSTGSNNTAVGLGALFQNSIGNNNTALGYNTNVTAGDLNNATMIGYSAVVDASNKVRIGNSEVSSIGGEVSWTNFLPDQSKIDIKENVPGLKFIKALRPVTYDLGTQTGKQLPATIDPSLKTKAAKFLKPDDKASAAQVLADGKTKQVKITGLIASEVDSAANKIQYNFSGVDKNGTTWGLRYSEFVVPLIKAVQELSKKSDEKDKQIDSLVKSNKALNDKLNTLTDLVKEIEEAIDQLGGGFLPFKTSARSNTLVDNSSGRPKLDQNIPNPFNGTTVIKYTIPLQTASAELRISDASGNLLKTITLSSKGVGETTFAAGTLPSGNYFYTLFVNGKTIVTRQMIVAR